MRKYYIDNIRWIAVLFLFPYHTSRIFDGLQSFYIKGVTTNTATNFVLSCTPWFMPVLFAVAGISARYALQKRSYSAYIRERLTKLFIPFAFGIILLIPVQTYYAEIFHNGYKGSYWMQFILFFTKQTNFSGYSGGFTPGQLWFVYYLFLFSLISIPLIYVFNKKNIKWEGYSNALVIPLCMITLFLSYVLDIGGKSMGEYFTLFLLGYFVLAEGSVQEFTDKYRFPLIIIGIGLTVCTVYFQISTRTGLINRSMMILTSWICILAIIGLGRHYLNFRNQLTDYLSVSSFPFYLFHQTWIVAIGYYVLKLNVSCAVQYAIILMMSFFGTLFTYEICKRFKLLRFMFAIKKPK